MNWKGMTFTALVWSFGALAASAQVAIPLDLPSGVTEGPTQSSVQYEEPAQYGQSMQYGQSTQYGQYAQFSQPAQYNSAPSYNNPVQYNQSYQFSQAMGKYSQPQFLQNMQYVQQQHFPQMMQYNNAPVPQMMQYGRPQSQYQQADYQQPQYAQFSQAQPAYQQVQYNQYQQSSQYQQPQANQQYQQQSQYANQAPQQGAPEGWHVVGAPGVFSAYMPGQATSTDASMNDTAATHWSADMGDPMHMFAIEMQYCGQVSGGNMDNLLFSLMNTRAKTVGADASHKRRIENQMSPGCMFDVVTGDTEWNYMIRVVGTSVVTMSVCSMPGQGNDEYVQQFFKSFTVR